MNDLQELLQRRAALFDTGAQVVSVYEYGNGHINGTYLAECADGSRFILQRINHAIFTEPALLMENVIGVSAHIRRKLSEEGGDTERGVLTYIPLCTGGYLHTAEDDTYWRACRVVDRIVTYESTQSAQIFGESGRAFGRFQRLLADYPADSLHEILPRFHHTPARVEALRRAVDEDRAKRCAEAAEDIAFALERAEGASRLVDLLSAGKLPLRVTHNDTKLNNVLFDHLTNTGICVIDLDTVMPGLVHYDFGDAIRFGATPAAEDEHDVSRIYIDMDYYRAFAEAFLSELGASLTPLELETLPYGATMMTYELAVRFLADYLNGDTYFKIHDPAQNLRRARAQLRLLADMERRFDEMCDVVRRCGAGAR